MTQVVPEIKLFPTRVGTEGTIPLEDAIGKPLNQFVLIEIPEGMAGSVRGIQE